MLLKRLHPDGSLSKASLAFWRKHSTPDIVKSLRPGVAGCLKVKANGIIMDGNTRTKILEERGYALESLPYEPYP
jgi:hypothetical protein